MFYYERHMSQSLINIIFNYKKKQKKKCYPLKVGKNRIKKRKFLCPHLKSSVMMWKKHRNKGNQKVPPIISYRKGIDEIELIEKQRKG